MSTRSGRRLGRRVNIAGWLTVAVVVTLTEGIVRGFGLTNSVAAPSATLRALAQGLSSGTLSGQVGTTLEAYAEGLALAVASGVLLGVCIGSSRTLRDGTFLVIEFLRPIPAVAMIPLAILFFGLGVPTRRAVVAFGAVWPILVNTIYGVRGVDSFLDDVARTSGVGRLGRIVRVKLPAALPNILTGIRVSASLALLICVTAEFVTGTGGIGAYMRQQENAFRLPQMYAALVLVGLLGLGINLGVRAAAGRVAFWAGRA